MRIIRIPLGSTLKDKEKFVTEFIRVFPANTKEKVEEIWNRQIIQGVLQIMLDVDTGIVTHVMRVGDNGTSFWELSSRFINKIPLIYDFNPEENPLPPQNLEEGGIQLSKFVVNTKTVYNIDELLDIITEKGYDKLSVEQKDFLAKYSKK